MIAKYKGTHFCIDLSVNPVELWRYDEVPTFKRCIDENLVYYSKFVDLDEVEKVFDVGFSVCWDGQWCGCFYNAEKDVLTLYTNNRDFAITHDMDEFERGVFNCVISADDFKEFRMWTDDYIAQKQNYTMVSHEEFKTLWKELIADLIPPR